MKASLPPLILLFILLNLFNTSGSSSKVLAKSHKAKTIKVGISVLEPWKYIHNGKFAGAEIDLFNEIARQLRAEVTYIDLPFKRALVFMESGEIDVLFGLLHTDEREKYIFFIQPPYKNKSNKAFYVLRDKERSIQVHEDLYGLTVGVKIGAKYFTEFDEDKGIVKSAVADYHQNIEKLLHGRIDTFICTESQGDYLLQSLVVADKIKKAEYGYSQENPIYFGISRKSWLMRDKANLEKIVEAMVNRGEVDRIFTEFFDRNNLSVPEYKQTAAK